MTPSSPSTLVVPGSEVAGSSVIPGGFTPALAGVALIVLGLALWVALGGRRKRRLDPRELAFRRVCRQSHLGRRQIRSLRRAARAKGLESPVGLAMSAALREDAFEHYARRGSKARAAA